MLSHDRQKIYIIIPVHNEQDNIAPLCERIWKAAEHASDYSFSILFVDDGSDDNTLHEIEKLVAENLPVGYLQLSRNFGHQAALEAGFSAVEADAVITMDGDLQHPPEEILRMLEAFEAGADVVQMQRKNITQDFKGLLSLSYYTFFKWISNAPMVANAADFRLVSRRVVTEITKMHGKGKLLRAIIPAMGFKQVCLQYLQEERKFNKSSYTYFTSYELALETIFKFSRFPAHFATITGVLLIITGIFILVLHSLHLATAFPYAFFSFLSITIGSIFLAAGIICWYLYFILEQVRSDPPYVIKKEVFPPENS